MELLLINVDGKFEVVEYDWENDCYIDPRTGLQYAGSIKLVSDERITT